MIREHTQQSTGQSARKAREVTRRFSKLTEAQAAMSWGVILLFVLLLGAIYLNQSSRTAAVGRHVQWLNYTLEEIRHENSRLERDIAEAQTLERLQQEAARMGFVYAQSTDIEYKVIDNYPAAAPSTTVLPARETERPHIPETMKEALTVVLQDRLNDLMRGESGE
jgi:cell division protein FtsL